MSAALIPPALVPVARTDADWALDISFQGEDWTGDTVKVAFARQGSPVDPFEIEAEAPTENTGCIIRVPAETWADKKPGVFTVEVRRFSGSTIDDAAVFQVQLYRGISDHASVAGAAAAPAGDGAAVGNVIVNRAGAVTVVRGGGLPRDARLVLVNDILLGLGAANVEEALIILAGNQGYAPGSLNFSNPNNTGLGLVLGVI